VIPQLHAQTILEELGLLLISVHVVSIVLYQIVEPLTILIDVVGPLLYVKELPLLAVYEAYRNMMPMECGAELAP
jgi:hypothetical protein